MTDVDVCNLALAHVGGATIVSLTEKSEEGRLCTRLYSHARDTLLRGYSWNFATKYEAGAPVSGATVYRFEYAYAYPIDCLKVQSIFKSLPTADPIVFKRVGAQIWTDEEEAILVYTQKITDPTLFDEQFTMALSHFLAALLVPSLIKSDKLRQSTLNLQLQFVSQAIKGDAEEGNDDVIPDSMDIFNKARK